jgi:hypothetical protein
MRSFVFLFAFLLLVGCGIKIIQPPSGSYTNTPVVAKVKFQSDICGNPFQAMLDGNDVTAQFAPPAVRGGQSQATFPGLPGGSHTLTVHASKPPALGSGCTNDSDTSTFTVNGDTPYMAQCRASGVPIPPDWAETGTAWVLQGNLRTSGGGTNLLQKDVDAFVWTYTDPNVRGACIALPRGGGGSGSLAGIICQGAESGNACFWDNQLKSAPNTTIGWRGLRLVISQLVDGDFMATGANVGGKCVNCHSGNNVFIISPDDPTWKKVIKDTNLTIGSTFTTNVATNRYTPLPVHPNWANPVWPAVAGQPSCGACHEVPNPGIVANRDQVNAIAPLNRMPMAPSCTSAPGGCYR